jgi:hypothetical protein
MDEQIESRARQEKTVAAPRNLKPRRIPPEYQQNALCWKTSEMIDSVTKKNHL